MIVNTLQKRLWSWGDSVVKELYVIFSMKFVASQVEERKIVKRACMVVTIIVSAIAN